MLRSGRESAELCSLVGWKAELVRDKCGCLTEEVSKPSVEDAAWFLLPAHGEM